MDYLCEKPRVKDAIIGGSVGGFQDCGTAKHGFVLLAEGL
jgi:hypothetical protein